jgi:RNA polymerase sigma-70 factor (ECF subfamily)
MNPEEDIIKGCLENDQKSQERFYKKFASKMFGVCLRYAKDQSEAEDILQEGFIKVFFNLSTFRNEGSLEGWVRRTIVNTAINYYKKNLKYSNSSSIEQARIIQNNEEGILDKLSAHELQKLVQELPTGYRLIFNLNVIEGFTHKEIGEMLGISENTSKSQLSRARNALQKRIMELYRNVVHATL